jgi:phytoene dehydrogenase-like protein
VPASLQPKVINELKLREHGLRLVERRAQNFLPLPDGRYLLTGEGRTDREIAKFSTRDAARYPAYQAEIGRLAETILTANQRLDLFRHVNFPVYELA